MSSASEDFTLLARLVRPQGRQGELLADILTDFPERFHERAELRLLPPGGEAPARAVRLDRQWLHKGRIVLKFAGVDSITEAAALAGCHVAIPSAQRAPLQDGAVYIGDLIGCRVFDETSGEDLGPIADVQRGDAAMADLLVIGHGDAELLIPFVRAFLVAVDLPARTLRMRLPSGLSAINAPLTAEERQRSHAGE